MCCLLWMWIDGLICLCFFNDTATTEIYTYCHTLALHDALPICISRLDGDVPVRRAIWNATGMSMASAPMFFTMAERMVTVPTSPRTCSRGEIGRAHV